MLNAILLVHVQQLDERKLALVVDPLLRLCLYQHFVGSGNFVIRQQVGFD